MERPVHTPLSDVPSKPASGLHPSERSNYLDNIFISDRIGLFCGYLSPYKLSFEDLKTLVASWVS
jgi:hypothetical protein